MHFSDILDDYRLDRQKPPDRNNHYCQNSCSSLTAATSPLLRNSMRNKRLRWFASSRDAPIMSMFWSLRVPEFAGQLANGPERCHE
jgi:hypothetical protein